MIALLKFDNYIVFLRKVSLVHKWWCNLFLDRKSTWYPGKSSKYCPLSFFRMLQVRKYYRLLTVLLLKNQLRRKNVKKSCFIYQSVEWRNRGQTNFYLDSVEFMLLLLFYCKKQPCHPRFFIPGNCPRKEAFCCRHLIHFFLRNILFQRKIAPLSFFSSAHFRAVRGEKRSDADWRRSTTTVAAFLLFMCTKWRSSLWGA